MLTCAHRPWLGLYFRLAIAMAMLCVIASQPATAQRVIANPSFEANDPQGPGPANWQIFPNGQVTGWDSVSGEIELWDNNFDATPAYQGLVFAEMNANVPGALYQNICLINGENIGWTFAHRARAGGPVTQTASFQIANSSGALVQNLATQSSTVNNIWNINTGSATYTGASGLQRVQFVTTNPGSYGNFLDDIRITLNPYVELSTATSNGIESTASANLPKLLINGTLFSAISVQVAVVGGTAVRGTDYTTPNGAASFTVTIPAGTYQNSPINTGIQILDDGAIESGETINLSLNAGTGYTIASTASCGGAAVTASTYTISDNDSQVTLTKNWTNGIAANAVSLSISGATSTTAGSSTVGGALTIATATAPIGATLTFTEAYSVGSAAHYLTTFECRRTSDNALIASSGSGQSFTATVPSASGMACGFTNTRRTATFTLRKTWVNAITTNAVRVQSSGFINNVMLNSVANSANETDSEAAVTLYAGESGTISELFTSGNSANYIASLACTGNATSLSGTALTVSGADTAIICTYTNTFNTPPTVAKSSQIISDPVNGTTNPKAIPGAVIRYCILVTNGGTFTTTSLIITDSLPAATTFVPGSMTSGNSCATATTVEDDNATGADESDPTGMAISGQTVSGSTTSLAPAASVALAFRVTVN